MSSSKSIVFFGIFAAALVNPCAALAQTDINAASIASGLPTGGDSPGFPVTLLSAGAYKLTENVRRPNLPYAGVAIEITGNDITLDLNGFSVAGEQICSEPPPLGGGGPRNTCVPSGTESSLILVSGRNVRIINGSVTGSRGDGIKVPAPAFEVGYPVVFSLENVVLRNNKGYGVNAAARGITFENVSAVTNGAGGLLASTDVRMNRVSASFNNLNGIKFETGVISNATATYNAVAGISAGGGVVTSAYVYGNGTEGVQSVQGVIDNVYSYGNFPDIKISGGGVLMNSRISSANLTGSTACYRNVDASSVTGGALCP